MCLLSNLKVSKNKTKNKIARHSYILLAIYNHIFGDKVPVP